MKIQIRNNKLQNQLRSRKSGVVNSVCPPPLDLHLLCFHLSTLVSYILRNHINPKYFSIKYLQLMTKKKKKTHGPNRFQGPIVFLFIPYLWVNYVLFPWKVIRVKNGILFFFLLLNKIALLLSWSRLHFFPNLSFTKSVTIFFLYIKQTAPFLFNNQHINFSHQLFLL